jgi:hypothetical protein
VGNRAAQLRPVVEIVLLAGLNLNVLREQLAAGRLDMDGDGPALRLEPKSRVGLAIA